MPHSSGNPFIGEDELLHFSYPLWVIMDVSIANEKGMPYSIFLTRSEDMGDMFPVFVDDDWAERCIADLNMQGHVAYPVYRGDLIMLLLKFGTEKVGGNVAIDFSGKTFAGRFYTVREFLSGIGVTV